MKKSSFISIKKLIAIIILAIMVITPVTSKAAFSFWPFGNRENTNTAVNNKYNDIEDYKSFLNESKNYLQGMDINMSIDEMKSNIIDRITELQENYSNTSAIPYISNKILNETISSTETDPSNFLNSITSVIQSSLGNTNIALNSLEPNVVVGDMVATTAGRLSGETYQVNLSGNIYYADVDSNGNPTSNKWVVLVHGFMMNGQAIADTLGEMYLDQGFNILAPDLRGFGNSGGNQGKGGMGYLDSLDIWDWLTYINEHYRCNEVIVHGVSLGGATTIFLSGLEVDGQTLKDKHVIGLVEDCGYTSMTGIVEDLLNTVGNNELVAKILGIFDVTSLSDIIDRNTIKDMLINQVDVGLTAENFDEHENALASLEKASLPILIIHGTADTTVPFENSTRVYETAMNNPNIPYIQRFEAEDEQHAFIVLGNKENVYKGHVENFISVAERIMAGDEVEKESTYQEETAESPSLISGLIKALRLIKNMFSL